MMQIINWFVDRVIDFFGLLTNLEIVPGVSVLVVIGAVIVLGILINQLVRRAG